MEGEVVVPERALSEPASSSRPPAEEADVDALPSPRDREALTGRIPERLLDANVSEPW